MPFHLSGSLQGAFSPPVGAHKNHPLTEGKANDSEMVNCERCLILTGVVVDAVCVKPAVPAGMDGVEPPPVTIRRCYAKAMLGSVLRH